FLKEAFGFAGRPSCYVKKMDSVADRSSTVCLGNVRRHAVRRANDLDAERPLVKTRPPFGDGVDATANLHCELINLRFREIASHTCSRVFPTGAVRQLFVTPILK